MIFKRFLLVFIVIYLCKYTLNLSAQEPAEPKINPEATLSQRNEIWFNYSAKLYEHISQNGIFADFQKIIPVAKRGLQTLEQHDLAKKCVYHYYIGMAYKVQLQNDSALKYLKTSIDEAIQSHHELQEILSINQINYLYRFLGKAEATQPYANELIRLLKVAKGNQTKDLIGTGLVEYYLHNGDFNQAIDLLLQSLPRKLATYNTNKSYDNKINVGLAYTNLGSLYLQLGQNRKALSNFNQAKPYLENYIGGTVRLYNNFLQAYINIENLDSAKYCYQQVYLLMQNKEKFYETAELSNANRFFADYYLEKRDYKQADIYAQLANQLALGSERPETILKAQHLLGLLNFYQQKYKAAIKYFKEALPGSSSFGKDFTNEILLKLAQSYENIGDFKQSLFYYKKYTTLSNQVFKNKSNEEISRAEIKYRTLEKEAEINNLNTQKKITAQLLKKKNQYQAALIILAVLLFFISLLIYINYINKRKANLLLDKKNKELDALNAKLFVANQTKARLFSIISHDLRSPVSQMFGFLKLQQQGSKTMTEEDRLSHQQDLLKSSHKLLETMEDLLIWSKSQLDKFETDPEEIDIKLIFQNVIDLLQSQALQKHISIKVKEMQFDQLITDHNMLLSILRNLLQNAINNAFEHTTIEISALVHHAQKSIKIVNTGNSISPNILQQINHTAQIKSKTKGYGLLLIKDLADKIDAEISIQNNPDSKVEVEIIFSA